jgi:hypothetical protein
MHILFAARRLAVEEDPQFPRVFAHDSEQNRRLRKADASSNREPKRFRAIEFPQNSQGFSPKSNGFLGI